MVRPPLLPNDARYPAWRAVARATTVAKLSGITLVVLAGLSAVLNLPHPWTVEMLVSVAVIVNGVIEWRGARRLEHHDLGATRPLMFNQLTLGVEICAYGLWKAIGTTETTIAAILDRPLVATVLDMLAPAERVQIIETLLPLLRAAYLAVALAGLGGCCAMALYYSSRRKHLEALAVSPAVS